jgi:hypothetical protein
MLRFAVTPRSRRQNEEPIQTAVNLVILSGEESVRASSAQSKSLPSEVRDDRGSESRFLPALRADRNDKFVCG